MTVRRVAVRLFRWSQSWPVFLLLFGGFVVQVVLHSWPASSWLHVRSVHVFDGRAGEPVHMFVDREIREDFAASFAVRVRVVRDRSTQVVCHAEAQTSHYSREAALPDPLTLDWWTHGRCKGLPEGAYTVDTTWVIDPPQWWFPQKVLTVRSNPFRVTP